MIDIFNNILNLTKKPVEYLLKAFELFWNWLVKYDKYVYLFLILILILGICL